MLVSEICFAVAIKRCYENHRRNFLEQQPGKEDFSREQGLNQKYRSRRERVNSIGFSVWIFKLFNSLEIQEAHWSCDTCGNGEILDFP